MKPRKGYFFIKKLYTQISVAEQSEYKYLFLFPKFILRLIIAVSEY